MEKDLAEALKRSSSEVGLSTARCNDLHKSISGALKASSSPSLQNQLERDIAEAVRRSLSALDPTLMNQIPLSTIKPNAATQNPTKDSMSGFSIGAFDPAHSQMDARCLKKR